MAEGVLIRELKHRVAICTMKDVVVSADRMDLRREAVVWTRAKIYHQPHLSSFLTTMGYTVKEEDSRSTHQIRVRRQLNVDYSSAAWIYEEFLQSSPRWYKVLGFVDESERIVMLDCHLIESRDGAKPVNGDLNPERVQVRL